MQIALLDPLPFRPAWWVVWVHWLDLVIDSGSEGETGPYTVQSVSDGIPINSIRRLRLTGKRAMVKPPRSRFELKFSQFGDFVVSRTAAFVTIVTIPAVRRHCCLPPLCIGYPMSRSGSS